MMGQQAGAQDQLFYSFNLEAHVPVDHLLRGIDRFLDLSELRPHLASLYSHTGRPSVDPELMIRMLLIGYCFGRYPSDPVRNYTAVSVLPLQGRTLAKSTPAHRGRPTIYSARRFGTA